MDTLGKLLKKTMKSKSTLSRQISAGLIVESVNEKIAELWGKIGQKQAKAVSYKGKRIKIHVANAVMASELRFKKQRIINFVNNKFGPDLVIDVNIVQKGVEKEIEM